MPSLHPAVSIGNENSGSESGTLGCFAQLRANASTKVLLSNHHVIFSAGTSLPLRIGSPSAGSCRCCCPKNIIARATTPGFAENRNGTYVDAAIAVLEPGVTGVNQISGLRGTDALGHSLNGFLQSTATVSDNQRVFVCTSSSSLPNPIIPCRVQQAAGDIPIDASHTENNQIILQVDPGFEQDIVSGSGDSGAIVVDEQNRIVGLMHSRGSSTAGGSIGEASNTIIACPINAVMDALQIDIPRQTPPSPSSGPLLDDLPLQEAAPGITDPELLRFQRLVKQSPTGLFFHDMGFRHGPEVVQLVHHCRPVTVAWHRSEGPAWAVHLINSTRDAAYRVPVDVKGITQRMLLDRMGEALSKHGSDNLRRDIETHGPTVLALAGIASVADLLQRLGVRDPDGCTPAHENFFETE